MHPKKYTDVLYYINFKKSSETKQFFDRCVENLTQIFLGRNVQFIANFFFQCLKAVKLYECIVKK